MFNITNKYIKKEQLHIVQSKKLNFYKIRTILKIEKIKSKDKTMNTHILDEAIRHCVAEFEKRKNNWKLQKKIYELEIGDLIKIIIIESYLFKKENKFCAGIFKDKFNSEYTFYKIRNQYNTKNKTDNDYQKYLHEIKEKMRLELIRRVFYASGIIRNYHSII